MHQSELLQKLFQFTEESQDGYAMYDKYDHLVYVNPSFAQLLGAERSSLLDMHFDEIMMQCHQQQSGLKIETNEFTNWLLKVHKERRSQNFRLFEMELTDGRWFLFSEQKIVTGEFLVHAKEISEQKELERQIMEVHQKLHQLALTDELTGVANRRSFVDSVEAEISRCQRNSSSIGFLLLDIDYFKRLNDSYGHDAGDKALKHFANVIQMSLRDYDIFGRIGGEEFAVFLAETPKDLALQVANRLRTAIENCPMDWNDGEKIPMTVSIGAAIAPNAKTDYLTLYNTSDELLYKAKGNGRNRVELVIVDG